MFHLFTVFFLFLIDLLVIIKTIGDVDSIFVSKKHRFLCKRIVTVMDDDACADIVFWGNLVSCTINATSCNSCNYSVLIHSRQKISVERSMTG